MVTLLGLVIGRYCSRHLDGEKRQIYFYRMLLTIVVSISLVVLSGNLLMYYLMWLVTSYSLYRLLLFYDDRNAARKAAFKKLVVSGIGDLSILIAIVLTFRLFGTLDLSSIFAAANSLATDSSQADELSLVSGLFVLGALVKSAQFPFHFWLPETMETPSPVSALMHAGIINAGGFLIIRLSPLLQYSAVAHYALMLVGTLSALFGALCMMTQNSIKQKLAYSTISQMGMMIFACGLGAYSIALFHIIAHSFYKAYAFLSTGFLVRESKKIGLKLKPMSYVNLIAMSLASMFILLVSIFVFGGSYFVATAYGLIMAFGLVQNLSVTATKDYSIVNCLSQIGLAMIAALIGYLTMEYLFAQLLSDQIPLLHRLSVQNLSFIILVVLTHVMFIAGFWLSGIITAVSMYEVALSRDFLLKFPDRMQKWKSYLANFEASSRANQQEHDLAFVWQTAWEYAYQAKTVGKLSRGKVSHYQSGEVQMIFCIDVRSEMIRRHIENEDNSYQTLGFAGFFAMPIEYQPLDETKPKQNLPVLLTPGYIVEERYDTGVDDDSLSHHHHDHKHCPKTDEQMVKSFFRNMRKAPFSSFLFVEFFGLISVFAMLKKSWKTFIKKINHDPIPSRFSQSHTRPKLLKAWGGSPSDELTVDDMVDRAATVLDFIGLHNNFGRLVVLVGHGADTTNNAMASALDCGACGGHSGDTNARFLASMLNAKAVREGLAKRGIMIPDETFFASALHETVTDRVFLLDEDDVPEHLGPDVKKFRRVMKVASEKTRQERQRTLSPTLDESTFRRPKNWSEVRPEWGLSGNASFVVAPRERSKDSNFASRMFLHNYVWEKDEGFKLLELIMTALMIVTNWINMQYYSSVVVPRYFGSGNKLLHNLTNETGVVEGNGGDLRIGLPLQSVHDGTDFIHEPLRLSVFIEAPRGAIEDIIERHKMVRDLIENHWLHLIHIDPETGVCRKRVLADDYRAIA